jgi:hypothetical protein
MPGNMLGFMAPLYALNEDGFSAPQTLHLVFAEIIRVQIFEPLFDIFRSAVLSGNIIRSSAGGFGQDIVRYKNRRIRAQSQSNCVGGS